MTDEEIAAVAAALLLATKRDGAERKRPEISAWAKAARDYGGDDETCSRRF
ncbi:MAG: hypothetical protein JO302_03220 [Candidatus Eremiobacteraeota bacterium]|nr:hypothetical protein [Candidatus Eremiobacteraeota bacterium]